MRVIFLVFLIFISWGAVADSMYKCTDSSGALSFQALPCSNSQSSENITVKPQTVEGGPAYKAATHYYDSKSKRSSGDEIVKQHKRDSKRNWDNHYRKKCERYTQYHDKAKRVWKRKQHTGYKQYEKERMEDNIEDTRLDMERECAEKYRP